MENHVKMFEEYMASDARGYDVGEYVYHVTPVENLTAIRKIGLLPRDGIAINGRRYENRLYFATSLIAAYDISVNFQSLGRGIEYAILKIGSEAVSRGYENDPLFEHGIYVDYPIVPERIADVIMANDLFGKYDDEDFDRLYEHGEYRAKLWWHGSKKDFDAFDEPQRTSTHWEYNIPTWWFTEDKDYAMKYANGPNGGWIYAVRLDLHNTLDLSIPEERAKFEEWLKARPSEYSKARINEIFEEQWGIELPYWTCDAALWYAAMEGYDSMYVDEELDESVTSVAVIENPSIIHIIDKQQI